MESLRSEMMMYTKMSSMDFAFRDDDVYKDVKHGSLRSEMMMYTKMSSVDLVFRDGDVYKDVKRGSLRPETVMYAQLRSSMDPRDILSASLYRLADVQSSDR